MKAAYYPILRIVVTLLLGVFMIIYPNSFLSYIAIVAGLILIIPGLIQLLRYLIVCSKRNRRDRRYNPMKFPIVATLCIAAGAAIIIFANNIIGIFSLLLAVVLIYAGINEIVKIIRSRRKKKFGYYVMPALLAILGVFILVNPLNLLPNIIVIMFGVGAIVYSINEIIYLARLEQ